MQVSKVVNNLATLGKHIFTRQLINSKMLSFVNAKINIGLDILNRRQDGYHNLRTIFYPVGKRSGTAESPVSFGDILEVTTSRGDRIKADYSVRYNQFPVNFYFDGNSIACSCDKNLVVKAACKFFESLSEEEGNDCFPTGGIDVRLVKELPDGAGLGGGSADASFLLRMLNDKFGNPFSEQSLARIALSLGADCPFFIYNRPMIGEGVGELLADIELPLQGCSLVIAKPDLHISTAEAFSCISPHVPDFDLHKLPELPKGDWREVLKNDFEKHLFEKYPILRNIKIEMYNSGAFYAQMSGSGSALYGIFDDEDAAKSCFNEFGKSGVSFYRSLVIL